MVRRKRTIKRRRAYARPVRRRRTAKGLTMNQMMWLGVGSGVSGGVGSLVSKYLPLGNFGSVMGGNLAEGLAGYGLWKFGKGSRPLKLMGQGMIIKVIGDVVENTASPLLASFGGNAQTPATQNGVIV